jgi:hypothetical protein
MDFAIEGSLHDWLVENRDLVDCVMLKWTWVPVDVRMETEYVVAATEDSLYDGWPIYAMLGGYYMDRKYSFHGDVEGAIAFTNGCHVWDGFWGFRLDAGLLHAEQEGGPEHPNFSASTLFMAVPGNLSMVSGYNLRFRYLAICDGGKFIRYNGPMKRREERCL